MSPIAIYFTLAVGFVGKSRLAFVILVFLLKNFFD
jgi:hypothetical protein